MDKANTYHCGIIGGGLAGLTLAIQLAASGLRVILFEKNQYPFHKVCGEYISMESWDFLLSLGVPLDEMQLPVINELGISSEKGFMLNHTLAMGGFGISRYTLDQLLFELALQKGVHVIENCKVNAVSRTGENMHCIQTSAGEFRSEILCGSYGKYEPAFMHKNAGLERPAKGNYIGVKYHVQANLSSNRIELHNFRDGYCGISKVDRDWHCLCYLTTAENLQKNGKNIRAMEENILHKNPFLKKYFTESTFVKEEPLVISNIQFREKHTSLDGIFLLGDAAGSITPLCGNGMSMGMRASKMLADVLLMYFDGEIGRQQIAENYRRNWRSAFHRRLTAGYYIQNLFGKKNTTDISLKLLSRLPSLTSRLISLTHGEKF